MKNRTDDHTILSLAEAIADGRPVAWDNEERRLPHLVGAIGDLRIIEKIAGAQRALAAEDPAVGAAEGEATVAETTLLTPDAGSDSWGPLRIRAKLGQGAFGEVFRAYDPTLDREVALKLIEGSRDGDPLDTKRFLDEARRLARVRHPNVLVVHGAETHAGRAGIWTDLLRGRTLQQYLAQEGTIGAQEAALIGMEICRALAAVHGAGLVHRDVKPANVMREEGGRNILMDFGAGVEAQARTTGALASTIQGTPLFMAPEQLRGAVTPAVDIYALGVLLYYAVSGKYPIEAARHDELIQKHRTGAAVPLRDRRPDLSPEFVQVIDRALDPNPEQRYASAGAFERALAGTLGPGARLAEAPVESGRRRAPGGWRGRAVVAARVVAVAASVILVVGPLTRHAKRDADSAATRPQARAPEGTAPAPTRGAGTALLANAAVFRGSGDHKERLQEGARIRPGDELSMTLESQDSVYVYVLDEDSNGAVFVLFPVKGLERSNPLEPGVTHRLPGRMNAQALNWKVTSAGGRENILVLANREPLAALEREIAKFPHATPNAPTQYGQLSGEAIGKLRGIGGMVPTVDSSEGSGSRLSSILGKVASRPGAVDQPWVWQIGLVNPPR